MKIIIVILICFSSRVMAQKKDSIPPKADSATIVMNQFLIFLQDKLTVKDYIPVQRMVEVFLKEYLKPKK